MKKKRFLQWQILLLFACLSFGLMSCGDDDENVAPAAELSVDVTQLVLSADGQSQAFRITSNTDWIITGNPNWLMIEPSTGSGSKNIVVKSSENTQTVERICELKIIAGDGQASEVVLVKQLAREENVPDETPAEKILGTWKFGLYDVDNGNLFDERIYTFFNDGVYVCWSQSDQFFYDEGTYSVSIESINIDGFCTDLDAFVDNSIVFFLQGYKYKGSRIVASNPELREENKLKFVGTWQCDVTVWYGIETSKLTINEDGSYTNQYIDDDDKYVGKYYVSEDKIYFEDATGKDPLSFYDIKNLTENHFELDNLYKQPVYAVRMR